MASLSAPADELSPLDPRVRTLWRVAGLPVAVVATLAAMAVDAVFLPLGVPAVLPVGVGVLAFGLAGTLPEVRYRLWRYALRPRDLWIRRGVFRVTVSVIPYRRLQFVDTRQGPLDRLFGLAQLVVYTAAPGTSGRLPGLDAAEAEQLRERLADVETDDSV
jgi:membrane protein YdbS with pleckstrin-like domain